MPDKILYLYGSSNLQNKRFQADLDDLRGGGSFDIQRSPIARGIGSVPVNKRIDEKIISLKGGITLNNNIIEPNIIKEITNFNLIFNKDSQFLRIVPNYSVILDPQSTTGCSLEGNASSLSLDSNSFQYNQSSLKFNIDTTVNASLFASLVSSSLSSINLTAFVVSGVRTGNIELFVDIPDNTQISSVELRLGSSSLAYYSYTFTTDYQGNLFTNGSNLLSIPWSLMALNGSPDNSQISFIKVIFNENAGVVSTKNFRVDGILWVDEDRVRNYLCTRNGRIDIPGDYYNKVSTDWKVSFLNYTGYAQSTHSLTLFNRTGVTSLSDTQIVDLEGSMDLQPVFTFTLNTVTNLSQLKVSNLTTGEYIFFQNTWSVGDVLKIDNQNKQVTRNGLPQDFTGGKLPRFVPGINKVKFEVIQSTDVIIQNSVYNASRAFQNLQTGTVRSVGQSFTSTINGVLKRAEVYGYGSYSGPYIDLRIYSDNAGNPGTLLYFDMVNYLIFGPANTPTWCGIDIPNLPLTLNSIYWIVLSTTTGNGANTFYWGYDSNSSYAGGQAKTGGYYPPTTAVTGDQTFRVTIAPSPTTNIDWKMDYKKLYI